MKEIWIDAAKLMRHNIVWPETCVSCGLSCNEYIRIKAIPTDVTTGGIRYLLGVSKSFEVPAHKGTVCEVNVRENLRRTELYPLLAFIFSAIALAIIAAIINPAIILFIFVLLAVDFVFSLIIDKKTQHPVKIIESPATGLRGAYEIAFMRDDIAGQFEVLNPNILIKD